MKHLFCVRISGAKKSAVRCADCITDERRKMHLSQLRTLLREFFQNDSDLSSFLFFI